MTTHQILVASKGYLLNHGWLRDVGRDGGPRCLIGALRSVTNNAAQMDDEPYNVLLKVTGARHARLGEWNDARSSVDEVIAALDAAILQTAPKDTPAPQPETASPSVTHVFA